MTAISVVATFIPKENHESAVDAILRGMVKPTREEPGCLRYELYGATGPEPQFVLIEAYADQAALEAHRATEHYKSYRSRIVDALREPIKVAVLNAIDAGQ
jgi:quinol monooxygenase YgiN